MDINKLRVLRRMRDFGSEANFSVLDILLFCLIISVLLSLQFHTLDCFRSAREHSAERMEMNRAQQTLTVLLRSTLDAGKYRHQTQDLKNASPEPMNVSAEKPISELIAESLYFQNTMTDHSDGFGQALQIDVAELLTGLTHPSFIYRFESHCCDISMTLSSNSSVVYNRTDYWDYAFEQPSVLIIRESTVEVHYSLLLKRV